MSLEERERQRLLLLLAVCSFSPLLLQLTRRQTDLPRSSPPLSSLLLRPQLLPPQRSPLSHRQRNPPLWQGRRPRYRFQYVRFPFLLVSSSTDPLVFFSFLSKALPLPFLRSLLPPRKVLLLTKVRLLRLSPASPALKESLAVRLVSFVFPRRVGRIETDSSLRFSQVSSLLFLRASPRDLPQGILG